MVVYEQVIDPADGADFVTPAVDGTVRPFVAEPGYARCGDSAVVVEGELLVTATPAAQDVLRPIINVSGIALGKS